MPDTGATRCCHLVTLWRLSEVIAAAVLLGAFRVGSIRTRKSGLVLKTAALSHPSKADSASRRRLATPLDHSSIPTGAADGRFGPARENAGSLAGGAAPMPLQSRRA